MKQRLFSELMDSLREALDHTQGKRELRTTVLPPAPEPVSSREVRELRKRLNASQSVFARYLNVSTKLVQAWEGGRRAPDGPALLLLRLLEQNPMDFLRGLYKSQVAEPRERRYAPRVAAKRRATKAR